MKNLNKELKNGKRLFELSEDGSYVEIKPEEKKSLGDKAKETGGKVLDTVKHPKKILKFAGKALAYSAVAGAAAYGVIRALAANGDPNVIVVNNPKELDDLTAGLLAGNQETLEDANTEQVPEDIPEE